MLTFSIHVFHHIFIHKTWSHGSNVPFFYDCIAKMEKNDDFNIEVGKKFANMVDNPTIHIIEGCGHMIMIEKAFEMREKVFEFLQK